MALLASVAAFALAGSAAATTLALLSLEEMVTRADLIVRVRCVDNHTRWENGEIWTLTSFAVEEALKGAAPRTITVRLPGGRVGHLLSTIEAVPRFPPGEEAVLFLQRTATSEFSIIAWVEGTFRVRIDAATGRAGVTQDSARYAVFDPATRRFRVEGIRSMPLEVFRQRVAQALARQHSRSQR